MRDEVYSHCTWIAIAWCVSAFLGSIIFAVVFHTTRWGRNFWRINKEFFFGRKSFKVWLYVGTILLLTLTNVRLSVATTYWNRGLFDSLQQHNSDGFYHSVIGLATLEGIIITEYVVEFYLKEKFKLYWRTFSTSRFIRSWHADNAYYSSTFVQNYPDNPEQRIESDTKDMVNQSVYYSFGLVFTSVYIMESLIVLIKLSGDVTIGDIVIPHAVTLIAILYALITTFGAFYLGRPLVKLYYREQQRDAALRFNLSKLRLNASQIAFAHGAPQEYRRSMTQFRALISTATGVAVRNTILSGFNTASSRMVSLFGFLIQSPRFFAEKITLGAMNQTNQMVANLVTTSSFFRESYAGFAEYRSSITRLAQLEDVINYTHLFTYPQIEESTYMGCKKLKVQTVHGETIVKNLNVECHRGDSLLITGPSGCGKTTLLFSLARLWPYSQGTVVQPENSHIMCIPQKMFLPEEKIRTIVLDNSKTPAKDSYIRDCLSAVGLGHYSDLDIVHDWGQKLSPGEQQRLSFAKILVQQPDVVFLDESTSALDESNEKVMYSLLREKLPDLIMISVGHRSTITQFHDTIIRLEGITRKNNS